MNNATPWAHGGTEQPEPPDLNQVPVTVGCQAGRGGV
jgi:hypothetical protein